MKHCGTKRLETNRLILRRYANEDAAAMYKNWASDKEVTKFLMWPAHPNQEVSQSVIEDWVNQYSHENYYHWAIVLKENGDEPRNPNSGKVMKKCGMKYEGTLRSADWNNQGICDACYYALLKLER
ncbi:MULTISPECIES: GNAT family N-acetyltransferase [Oscillospiraceae]|uniref:GNAT family N-acetyltransferase n=1 Tax=Oscillospiraceae TaxID=216572 RepID=UPI001106982B|nr:MULTISPECIES: GNAT family N-acetyltransferase [Oscillospiraceae]